MLPPVLATSPRIPASSQDLQLCAEVQKLIFSGGFHVASRPPPPTRLPPPPPPFFEYTPPFRLCLHRHEQNPAPPNSLPPPRTRPSFSDVPTRPRVVAGKLPCCTESLPHPLVLTPRLLPVRGAVVLLLTAALLVLRTSPPAHEIS